MRSVGIALKSVSPSSSGRENLQNILNRITSKPNELDSMIWYFDGVSLDFGVLESLLHRYPYWWINKPIDLIFLIKLLYLESLGDSKQSSNSIKDPFDALIHTFFYLAENNTDTITKELLPQYIAFLMMHTIESSKLVSLMTPKIYKTTRKYLTCFREWPRILSVHGLKGLVLNSVFSEKIIESAAKNAIEIESGGDLTYRDWQEGGSFNRLTLDYGRYYVEHCAEFFDQHIGLALALKKTIKKLPSINEIEESSYSECTIPTIYSHVNRFLIGLDVSIDERTLKRTYYLNPPRFEKIFSASLREFSSNLRQMRAIEALHSDMEIDSLAKTVGFKELDEYKLEWIRHLIDIREPILIHNISSAFSPNSDSEYNCFKSVIGNSFDLDALNRAIDCAYERLLQSVSGEPPPFSFYKSIDYVSNVKKYRNNKGILLRFLSNVEHSGIVKFVALTGWRKSEYGFSVSDIETAPNRDILDQFACPVRYRVNWMVPKTNGGTKLHRDITRSAYRCAYQLSLLVNAKTNDPCLYSFTSANKIPKNSGGPLKHLIPAMWSHFVDHYEPFVKLDLLEELGVLRNEQSHNQAEAARLVELAGRAIHEHWNSLKLDPLLVTAHRRAREEHNRIVFYLGNYKPKNWVWEYRNGKLLPEFQTMLDTYLSEETRTIINNLQAEQDVTIALGRGISNELIGECLYPTPHAFRHMWAEAVYRRFDGDAGWMIRSQFKHISPSMWLAYIRNKDNRRQHDRVKRQVISSLLANYLRKSGEGYAGAMDKLLRRLFLLTTSVTIEQLNTSIEQYGTSEILDIKANPWGYCLLRRRNQAHAKCADGGVPQRHNASPTLCLGCTNNLTQETNIPGILLGISNDLKVLHTPQVPESFRRASYTTVSNALKQLRKLGADQETLDESEAALKAFAEKRRLS